MTGLILPILAAIVLTACLVCLLMWSIRYRLTSRHLVILCLGVPVRRFALKDMTSVSKRRRFRAEHWISTFRLKHRKLVIRRDRGWFREIVITPEYRYVFRRELEEAVSQADGGAMVVDTGDE